MPVFLDHLIVPSHDQDAGAQLLGELLGVPWSKQKGHFSPVYVSDSLTMDFGNSDTFDSHHYAFEVTGPEFEAIFARIKAANLTWGGHPFSPDDGQVNTRLGGKNIYWRDHDGHLWEMLTVSYSRMNSPSLSAVS